MSPQRYRNSAEFRPVYLRDHSRAQTRAPHCPGTGPVGAIAVFAVATGRRGWPIAMPVAGYVFARPPHFTMERNPTGRLGPELRPWARGRARPDGGAGEGR